VELFEDIRGDERRQDVSIRELASPPGALADGAAGLAAAVPPPQRPAYWWRRCPAMDPWRPLVDGSLIGDQVVPRRQPHTARRVWQWLVAESQAGVPEVTVSQYVRRRQVRWGIVDREVSEPRTSILVAGGRSRSWIKTKNRSTPGFCRHLPMDVRRG